MGTYVGVIRGPDEGAWWPVGRTSEGRVPGPPLLLLSSCPLGLSSHPPPNLSPRAPPGTRLPWFSASPPTGRCPLRPRLATPTTPCPHPTPHPPLPGVPSAPGSRALSACTPPPCSAHLQILRPLVLPCALSPPRPRPSSPPSWTPAPLLGAPSFL